VGCFSVCSRTLLKEGTAFFQTKKKKLEDGKEEGDPDNEVNFSMRIRREAGIRYHGQLRKRQMGKKKGP